MLTQHDRQYTRARLWQSFRFPRGIVPIAAVIVASSLGAQTAKQNDAVKSLRDSIVALAPRVRADEAQRAAAAAYATADELRRDYRVVGPPLFHNFLVNTGIRRRGLCFQWAEDLLARLDALKLSSVELHWGEARAGTFREHNCVVVTAKGQPFRSGIVLDCWRRSGRLYWSALAADHYPWVEDSAYAQIARSRRTPPARGNNGPRPAIVRGGSASPSSHTFEWYEDRGGQDVKTMEITYTRKK